MRVAIYGSRRQEEFIDEIMNLVEHILEMPGNSIVMHEKIYSLLSEREGERFARIMSGQQIDTSGGFAADMAISIGGDGTFLRTAQWIGDKEIPVLGVNTGHLGFLAPFTVSDAMKAVDDDCLANYKIMDRSLLQVEYPYGSFETWPYAVNEVAFMKRDSASMIGADVRINGAQLANYLCDGLIVSTPTGSTGYNLSVGGPILQPWLPDIVLSPVAAHSLSMRPLVIGSDSLLEVKVLSRTSSYRISLDGRSLTMPCGSSVFVSRAPFVMRTIEKPDHNFFATLREKLFWGATPLENKFKE